MTHDCWCLLLGAAGLLMLGWVLVAAFRCGPGDDDDPCDLY